MNTYVIRRKEVWNSPEELEQAGARSKEVADIEFPDEIRWIRSYVIVDEGGSLGTVCMLCGLACRRTRSSTSPTPSSSGLIL